MSRRRFEPVPFGTLTPGWPIVRLRCTGGKHHHKAVTVAYAARAPESERMFIDGTEAGGIDIDQGRAVDMRNEFRDTRDSGPHMTYRFSCPRCALNVPVRQDRLRGIVDNALSLGIIDIPLDRG